MRVHGPFRDVLPERSEALRKYDQRPVFLKPQHCMLCDQEFDSKEELDAHTELEHREFQCVCGERFGDEVSLRAHLSLYEQEGESAKHGVREDVPTYRQKVFAQAICDWPTAVTAPVHRTRLYEMKTLTTNSNFGFSTCACCATQKETPRCNVSLFPGLKKRDCQTGGRSKA